MGWLSLIIVFFYRRIAYQEASQTFGVISMRLDLQDSNGMTPTRPSASTHAAMTTSSSSGKMVTTGTSTMGEHTYGDEVEVHTLLVIDQHTFEGEFDDHKNKRYGVNIFRNCY